MKKVFVRKIFPYDPTFDGKLSRYDGYCLITSQEKNPDIISTVEVSDLLNSEICKIFCSDLNRGKETAEFFADQLGVKTVVSSKLLREVKFDLGELLSREEFDIEGSNLVRERFLKAFEKDTLTETCKQIEERINGALELVKKEQGRACVIVSHSFFMKILEAYLKEPDLFGKKSKLALYLKPNQKTFDFGEGFEFDI